MGTYPSPVTSRFPSELVAEIASIVRDLTPAERDWFAWHYNASIASGHKPIYALRLAKESVGSFRKFGYPLKGIIDAGPS